jgi:hypothetical protein
MNYLLAALLMLFAFAVTMIVVLLLTPRGD